ncbi:MAG: hypothetical protein Fur0037_05750 [Planctomycetota bacterium]
MDHDRAVSDVLLGASLMEIAGSYRQELIDEFGLRPEDVTPSTFERETASFMRKLCRILGEKHQGDPRVAEALREYVQLADHYEAFDALLTGFRFEGMESVIRRGRILFPGPLTAHWSDE